MNATAITDPSGTDLPDTEAALIEARDRALAVLREGFSHGEDRRDWVMVVRDEFGTPLKRLTLGAAAGPALAGLLS
jgi:hypothetical protein